MTLLILVLIAAVYVDLRERRIPNSLIVAGLIAGCLASFQQSGVDGLHYAAAGMVVAAGVFLPFFAFRLVGAGDVKLLVVVASFVGLTGIFPVLFYTFLAGGLLGLGAVVVSGTASRLFWNFQLWLMSLANRGGSEVMTLAEIADQSAVRIPYSVSIAAGVGLWLWVGP
jgi:prepilin peptidase CpaA